VRRLSGAETVVILGACVTIFLLVNGPIWRDPWNPDASILISYIPIPFLVLVALWRHGRPSLVALALDTLRVTLLKFGVTASILLCLWSVRAPPPVKRMPIAGPPEAVPETHRPALRQIVDPSATGVVVGRVLDSEGRGVPDATVFIEHGLSAYDFPQSPDTTVLTMSGGGFDPDLPVIDSRRPLGVRSGDGRLHTLHVRSAEGQTRVNTPVLGSGKVRLLSIPDAEGLCTLRCDIHPEERGAILALPHPFVTRTTGDGGFTLSAVPAGVIRLGAYRGPAVRISVARPVEVVVVAKGSASTNLTLVPLDLSERDQYQAPSVRR
jgi:hypothetical protein